MSGKRQAKRLVATTLALILAIPAALAADREFPQRQPVTRTQAIEQLQAGSPAERSCLTPEIQLVRTSRSGGRPAPGPALGLLRWSTPAGETRIERADGLRVRYTQAPGLLDRIDPTDTNGNGRPDVLTATLAGVDAARDLLVDRLELPAPQQLELLLVELGDDLDGYTVPTLARVAGSTVVLDATPTLGVPGARRTAIHQYAHAVALALDGRFSPSWAEAFATWAVLAIEGGPDETTLQQLDRRLGRMTDGLLSQSLDLAAGNALWLAFLDEAYGPAAVRMTITELARGAAVMDALDRGLRGATGDDLATAFREFHVWSLLVGGRSDRQHFSFAERLTAPGFASAADGLPALSVRADPAIGSLGATQVRLSPERSEGGLRVHFEGEFDGRWQVDLLLVGEHGGLRRHPLPLTDGRGESTVPLNGLDSAMLLIRNLSADAGSHRYTYAAHHEKSYPFELAALETHNAIALGSAVEILWTTASEQDLLGFNVLRSREDDGSTVAVNPIWIPALGDGSGATTYRFLDRTAEAGVPYLYRIEGITRTGLTSLSDATPVVRPMAGR